MPDLRAVCFAGLVLAASAPLAAQEAPAAVFTRVAGAVTVDAPGPAARAPRRAAPMQVLRPGSVVHAPAAASAVIVCSIDRMVELDGPASWRLTSGGCAAGRELPAGLWRSLEQAGGTPVALPRGFLEERRSRGSEDDGHPVLLSPRGRLVGTDRPALSWTAVEGAEAYEVRVQGVVTFTRRFPAAELACGPETGWRPDRPVTVCTVPWPEEEMALVPGFPVWMRVLAKRAGESAFAGSEEEVPVDLGPLEAREDWAALPFDPPARRALEAVRAFDEERFGAAAAAHRERLAEGDDPAIRVLLGDALAGLGLLELAQAHYLHAEASGPREVAAAARQRLAILEEQAVEAAGAR